MNNQYSAPLARGFIRSAWGDLRNLVSLLVFFCATALMFRSLEFALIVTASLGFHELGHAAVLTRFRTNWRISFGLVGAYTWSPAAERNKLSNLQNTAIHLAGPFFSILLAMAAMSAARLFPFDEYRLMLLANFSAQVGLLNLLPFASLTDGGKVVRRVIAPLGGMGRTWAALLPLMIAALMLVLYTIFIQPISSDGETSTMWLGMILMAAWMTSSVLLEAKKDGSGAQPAGRPVTPVQGFLLLAIQWGLLALALLITAATPFWLAPEYVIGSLENFVDVLRLLSIQAF